MSGHAQDATAGPAPIPPADEELVRRCQGGEREHFRALFERYGDVVFGTVLLMTHDRPLAEDLTQEAFLNAWKGIGRFRLGSPFKPWIVRIGVNCVLSHRRRRLGGVIPLPAFERRDGYEPGPEALIELESERSEVRAALRRLSQDDRRLLVLRYYTELSVPEIARFVRRPEGTVKSRLHRALERMRGLLTQEPPVGDRGVTA